MDDLITDLLLRIVGNSPVFGLLLYIWWTERADRIECQRRMTEIYERMIHEKQDDK